MVHGDRSVDVFVRKLRQKLERASPDWRYIHTHFGDRLPLRRRAGRGARGEALPVAGAGSSRCVAPAPVAVRRRRMLVHAG